MKAEPGPVRQSVQDGSPPSLLSSGHAAGDARPSEEAGRCSHQRRHDNKGQRFVTHPLRRPSVEGRVCFDGINPQRWREPAEARTATRDGQAGPAWQIQQPSLPSIPGAGSWVAQEANHPPHGRLEGAAAGVMREGAFSKMKLRNSIYTSGRESLRLC